MSMNYTQQPENVTSYEKLSCCVTCSAPLKGAHQKKCTTCLNWLKIGTALNIATRSFDRLLECGHVKS